MDVVSEELGVLGVITPPLYRRIGAEPNVNTTASTYKLVTLFELRDFEPKGLRIVVSRAQ